MHEFVFGGLLQIFRYCATNISLLRSLCDRCKSATNMMPLRGLSGRCKPATNMTPYGAFALPPQKLRRSVIFVAENIPPAPPP